MNTHIRLATVADLATVQSLNSALFVADGPHDADLDLGWSMAAGQDYFAGAISGESGVCLVAEAGGEVVGYLVGAMHEEVVAYRPVAVSELENMFVVEAHRGQGIGAQLVERFKDWSRLQGAEAVQVSAYAGNVRAQAFYRRMGFGDYALTLEARLD